MGEGGVNKVHYGQCESGEFKGFWKLKYRGKNLLRSSGAREARAARHHGKKLYPIDAINFGNNGIISLSITKHSFYSNLMLKPKAISNVISTSFSSKH